MFVDFRNAWPPPEPWEPPRPRPRLSQRAERTVAWIVAFNLLMLVVGPLAGVTLFDVAVALVRR